MIILLIAIICAPNNRTDKSGVEFGGVYGMAKAVVEPFRYMRQRRKCNRNLRETGKVNTGH